MANMTEMRLSFDDGREIIVDGPYIREVTMRYQDQDMWGAGYVEVDIRLLVPTLFWRHTPEYPEEYQQERDEIAPPRLQIPSSND